MCLALSTAIKLGHVVHEQCLAKMKEYVRENPHEEVILGEDEGEGGEGEGRRTRNCCPCPICLTFKKLKVEGGGKKVYGAHHAGGFVASKKLEACLEKIKEVQAKGEKVLVFSGTSG